MNEARSFNRFAPIYNRTSNEGQGEKAVEKAGLARKGSVLVYKDDPAVYKIYLDIEKNYRQGRLSPSF